MEFSGEGNSEMISGGFSGEVSGELGVVLRWKKPGNDGGKALMCWVNLGDEKEENWMLEWAGLRGMEKRKCC